jgi:hypothetical protein
MTAPELFEGFADRRAQLETDLVAEHGEGVRDLFRASGDVTKGWTHHDHLDAQRRGEEVDDKVMAVMRAGTAPDSPKALRVMEEHYRSVAQLLDPGPDQLREPGADVRRRPRV